MKKIYIILATVIIVITTILFTYNKNNEVEYIDYNGVKLAMLVDGKGSTKLPTGNKYFLVRYECPNGTELSWDVTTSTLTSKNANPNDKCHLEFESHPNLYDLVNIGDYIEYTGNNGCTGNKCTGRNANQTNTDIYENYGYCYGIDYYFTTYGWRVLYKNDNSVYIVSAGAPECVTGIELDSEATKQKVNNAALKYCNSKYMSNGICTFDTAHGFNGDDFYKFTSQYYGLVNGRYLYSYNDGGTYDETGTKKCYDTDAIPSEYCGYNNDIIDNGSYFWYASAYNENALLFGNPYLRRVGINGSGEHPSFGVRPVLKLDSSILVKGGLGTMKEPYTITEREQQ